MADTKFAKPWHGVPREDIHWNPTIIEEACIGCGRSVEVKLPTRAMQQEQPKP